MTTQFQVFSINWNYQNKDNFLTMTIQIKATRKLNWNYKKKGIIKLKNSI